RACGAGPDARPVAQRIHPQGGIARCAAGLLRGPAHGRVAVLDRIGGARADQYTDRYRLSHESGKGLGADGRHRGWNPDLRVAGAVVGCLGAPPGGTRTVVPEVAGFMNIPTNSGSCGSVQLRRFSRSFQGRRVLDDIDLDIPAGQFVALLGESGSGKTTLLRALAGLDGEAQSHGAAYAHGNVSVLFQDSRLLPWLSVIDNLTLGLKTPEARAAAEQMLY